MDDDLYLPGDGLEEPHYTQFPNLLLDWVMPKVSNAEWKVLCYLCRLTWGYHRYDEPTPITLAQIRKGTGLSQGAVVAALALFRERGFIEVEMHTSAEHGQEANTYRLRVHKGRTATSGEARTLSRQGAGHSGHGPPPASGQPSSLYIKKRSKEKIPPLPTNEEARAANARWGLCTQCGCKPCTC